MKTKSFLWSIFGASIQYFNYALFSLSSYELATKFMPGESPESKLTSLFSSIILTVLARPLGSIFFGYIGDNVGRKKAVLISGILSSFGAGMVALLPSFESIGIYASIGLLIARMIFLSGLTGEIDGIRLYISENMPRKWQNLGNGLVTFLTQIGALLASMSILFASSDSWHYFFYVGSALGFAFSIIRIYLPESREFQKEGPHNYFQISISQIFSGSFKLLFCTSLITGTIGALYQYVIIFSPIYAKIDTSIGAIANETPKFIFAYGFGGLCWGYAADRINSIKLINSIQLIILVELLCLISFKNSSSSIYYQMLILSFTISGFSVPMQIFLKQKINIGIRYRIFSLGHSFGSILFSAPTAYICTKLSTSYGSFAYGSIYPAIILCASALAIKNLK